MTKEITMQILKAILTQAEVYEEECRVRYEVATAQVMWIRDKEKKLESREPY